jgi:aryl-alcohol dehydrogenase-like predicted oxidoreductase
VLAQLACAPTEPIDDDGTDTMETRSVGSLEVSVAGLGCNNFGRAIDEARAQAVVQAALEAGVNHFDTADVYGKGSSEEFLGRALGKRRGDSVITTKVGLGELQGGASGARVLRVCDESLARLGTDYIDLYLLHGPDGTTPIAETMAAFGKLVAAGKVREIGCSNFSAAQLVEAETVAKELGVPRFVNLQNDYSLLNREVEADVLPACERLGVVFMPYFPLASGLLTGKYTRGQAPPEGTRLAAWGAMADTFASDERFDVVDRLTSYAEAHGYTLSELALSWLAGAPTVGSVIAGATSPEQVRANAAATTAWVLTPAERVEVDALARVGG